MSRFTITATPLAGLMVLERHPRMDARGYLERLFCIDELKTLLAGRTILQINHTFTAQKGTVRGLHFQHPPHAEMKFVHCLRGEVFDVAVDLRKGSPTFLKWHAEVLTPDNHKTLVIPEGFAHGFQTLTDDCEMLYFHTAAYHPNAEAGLHPLDLRLAIHWPLPVAQLSTRDGNHPMLDDRFEGLVL
ncbi:MAG: dTDP-4-dehydrorhamnose 3,5-epimerase [Thermosynechococcus sp.]|uniref:dTDP-4-dehydrorhamnose 3,5-epimerase family protein n=1 Tax=Thermosynechococcus sp. TaxID=2814275 RepID=UPI0021FB8C17|nr:dTDP-4-dehydrorhamnose 3,5-epimerase family protein [Thermosynechococcus sp.]BCX12096.1 MAG: dTDP-4-dehydrorhamnose 3,5-epimerase [Thermosynechococcus sp.]